MVFLLLTACAAEPVTPPTVNDEPAEVIQAIAFPGAEGFGKYATGGRGGDVIVVTTLADDGAGSLRQALRVKKPRVIVFAVSGTIELKSPLKINYGHVTIAGQSAPGDGVCLSNYPLAISSDNVIIRFLRFRLGDKEQYEGDALTGTGENKNIIIDHCSISWATDECASFYNNSNFTLQWSIISESLNQSVHTKGDHGYGGIWGGKGVTYHHNLIASHNSRTPRFSGSSTTPNTEDELVDFRNNVIYNWMSNNIYGGEKGKYNVVNNYFKAGPATKSSRKDQILNPSEPYGRFFVSGNYLHGNASVTSDNKAGVRAGDATTWIATSEFEAEKVRTVSAVEAFEEVLENAGASFRRDAVDTRIIREVRDGNSSAGAGRNGIIDSQSDVGGWPDLNPGSPVVDTDKDGMPDDWETENGLDPLHAADAKEHTLDEQYTNIEVYLNELVRELIISE